jgi:uncharacterized protein YkvS
VGNSKKNTNNKTIHSITIVAAFDFLNLGSLLIYSGVLVEKENHNTTIIDITQIK